MAELPNDEHLVSSVFCIYKPNKKKEEKDK